MGDGADFWNQIRRLMPTYQPARPTTVQVPSSQGQPEQALGTGNLGALSPAHKIAMIIKAAKAGVMVRVLYNSEWRFMEPYSFRAGKSGRLFYAYCRAHPRDEMGGHTASLLIEKIEAVEITEQPYSPKWPVELK